MSEYKKQIGALVDAFVTQVSELAHKALVAALAPTTDVVVYPALKPSTNIPDPTPHLTAATKKLVKKIRKSTKKAVAKTVKKIERNAKDAVRAKRLDSKKAYRLRKKKTLTADQISWLTKYERKHGKPLVVAA